MRNSKMPELVLKLYKKSQRNMVKTFEFPSSKGSSGRMAVEGSNDETHFSGFSVVGALLQTLAAT